MARTPRSRRSVPARRAPGPRTGGAALGLLLLMGLAGAAGGCAKARAETAPDGPPLVIPAPPPRVLAPVEEPLAAQPIGIEPTVPVAAGSPSPPPARRPIQRSDADARTEPTPPSPEPARELRPAGSAADAELDRRVRDLVAAAARDLGRVDYRRLSAEGRQQYDQSKRFSDQALDEVKRRNYVYAETLADKAASLAAQLLGR